MDAFSAQNYVWGVVLYYLSSTLNSKLGEREIFSKYLEESVMYTKNRKTSESFQSRKVYLYLVKGCWKVVFLFGTWIVSSCVPKTIVFLIELIMSLFYQPNSLIGTLKPFYSCFLIISKWTVLEFYYRPLFGTLIFANI